MRRTVCPLIMFLTLFSFCFAQAQSFDSPLPVLAINELDFSGQNNDDLFVELVVISRSEIPYSKENEYSSVIIDDSNVSTGSNVQPGFISLSARALADMQPGDIIVLHGSNTQVPPNSDGVAFFSVDNINVRKYQNHPNQFSSAYNTETPVYGTGHKLTDFIQFSDSGDALQLKIGESFTSKLELNSNQTNYSLSSGSLTDYQALPKTIGTPNNPENEAFIENLKNLRDFELECTMQDEGAGLVKIFNGVEPFLIECGDIEPIEEAYARLASLGPLSCGTHTVYVTDAEGDKTECTFTISADEILYINHCAGNDFLLPIQECDLGNEPCYSLSINDGPYQVLTKDDVAQPFDITEDTNFKLTITNKQGSILQKLEAIVHYYNIGDSCNDGDECTKDDKINLDCECKGISYDEMEITVESAGSDCENVAKTLIVEEEFDWYDWYYQEYIGSGVYEWRHHSYGQSVNVGNPGLYKVETGFAHTCKFEKEIFVFSQGDYNPAISATKEFLCTQDDQSVLSINQDFVSSTYPDIRWYDRDENEIGLDKTLLVQKPGVYLAKFLDYNDCPVKAYKRIYSTLKAVQLTPIQPILCPGGDPLILKVEGMETGMTVLEWRVDGEIIEGQTGSQLEIVNLAGRYEVKVSSGECEVTREVEVIFEQEFDPSILLSNGFEAIQVRIDAIALKTNNDPIFKNGNSCTVNGIENDYQVTIDNQSDIWLKDYLLDQLGNLCDCNFKNGILLRDDICNSNLDQLFTFNRGFDNSVIGYLEKSSVGETTWLYVKKNSGGDHNLKNNYNPDAFIDLINSIVCELSSESNSSDKKLVLDGLGSPLIVDDYDGAYYSETPYNHIWGVNAGLFNEVIFGHSSGHGAHVDNYISGATILLDSNIDREEATSYTSNGQTYNGDFFMYKFQYEGAETCDSYLRIIIDRNQSSKLIELFEPNPLSYETIVQVAVENSVNNNDNTYINKLPHCLLTCPIISELFTKSFKDNPQAKSAINRILDLKIFPENKKDSMANCIVMDVFDNYNLTKPYLDNVFGWWKGRIPFLSRMTDLSWQANLHPIDIDNTLFIRLEGDRYAWIFGDDFFRRYDDNTFYATRYVAASDKVTQQVTYEGGDYDYYRNYPVRLDEKYDFKNVLPSDDSYVDNTQRSNGQLPGIHILYTIEKILAEQAGEDINTTLNAALLVTGFAELGAAYRLTRLGSISSGLVATRAALGGTDILASVSHILLDDNFICSNLNDNFFCEEYKKYILPIVDLTLLSGSIVSFKYDDIEILRKRYQKLEQDSPQKIVDFEDELRIAGGGQEAVEDWRRIFINNYDALWINLKNSVGNDIFSLTHGDQYFKDFVARAGYNTAWNTITQALEIRKLNPLDGKAFLDDILSTVNAEGKIGKGAFGPNHVQAYPALKNLPLEERSDVFKLETVDLYITERGKNANFVRNEISTAGSYRKWLGDHLVTIRKNGKVIDRLTLEKQFDNHLDVLVKYRATQRNGIVGAHNRQVVYDNQYPVGRIKVINETETVPGIWEIEYRLHVETSQGEILPVLNSTQNGSPRNYDLKTTYAPHIWSREDMMKAGYYGLLDAIDNNTFIGRTGFEGYVCDFDLNGSLISFKVEGFYDNGIHTWWLKRK